MLKAAAANGWLDERARGARSADVHHPRWRRPDDHVPRQRRRATGSLTDARMSHRGAHSALRGAVRQAQALLPGGVDSPVRAFRAVGGTPRFIARGKGARVWDVDGNRVHRLPRLRGARSSPATPIRAWSPPIQEAAARGTSYGAPTEAEIELARLVTAAFPSIDLVRFVSSGTEATMTALRLARALHRSREDHQVRRRLSRPRGRTAGPGWLGSADARRSRFAWRALRGGRADAVGAVQRPGTRCMPRSTPTLARLPRSSSSPSPATWASCRPSRAFSSTCAPSRASTARC